MRIPETNIYGVPCAIEEHLDPDDFGVAHGLVLVYEYGRGFVIQAGKVEVNNPISMRGIRLTCDNTNITHLRDKCPYCQKDLEWKDVLEEKPPHFY